MHDDSLQWYCTGQKYVKGDRIVGIGVLQMPNCPFCFYLDLWFWGFSISYEAVTLG